MKYQGIEKTPEKTTADATNMIPINTIRIKPPPIRGDRVAKHILDDDF
jgi:hypothetical protein